MRKVVVTTNSRRRALARNVDFSFTVSGSERTFTFRVSLNTLPTLATLVTLVRDIKKNTLHPISDHKKFYLPNAIWLLR